MSQFFASGGQNIGVSATASVLPINIQDWFPLGLTGWISLQSKELSILMPSAFFMVVCESRSVMSDSLQPHGLYSPWNSPGQNTGVGSLSLLQGIFPAQGSNSGLPHYRRILYQLSHKGSLCPGGSDEPLTWWFKG